MNDQALERMLLEGKTTAEDVLRQTAAEQVDAMTEMLLRHLPYNAVRNALHERIRGAPLADYMILRNAYFKHCDHVPKA